jgi:hypothetical protein
LFLNKKKIIKKFPFKKNEANMSFFAVELVFICAKKRGKKEEE